jgi:hypothetical protein
MQLKTLEVTCADITRTSDESVYKSGQDRMDWHQAREKGIADIGG